MLKYTINHFSLSLPAGKDRSNIAHLMKHLAENLERKGLKSEDVQDIVFFKETEDNGEVVCTFTVYYY